MFDDTAFWAQRLAAKKTQLIAFEAAITALTIDGMQSYRLMTGQTDQQVTRANLAQLREAVSDLENDISTLQARICGASHQGQPGF
jgi:hypothetical protein